MRLGASQSRNPVKYPRAIIRLSVFVLALSFAAFGQTAPSAVVTPLELNKPFEGAVGAGKKQTVSVDLAVDQYAAFRVESENVKLGVTQIKPDGDRVGIIGFANLTQNAKFAYVATAEGKYQVEVFASSRSPEGTFKITLVELRAATEREKGLQISREFIRKGLELTNEGNITDARENITRGLELREKLMGKESDGVAEALNMLSLTYVTAGDYTGGIDLKIRSLDMTVKLHGDENDDAAQLNFEIGALYAQKGDRPTAEKYLLKSVDILKRMNKLDSVIGSYDYGILGEIAFDRRELAKSSEYFQNALAANEKMFGPEHYHLVGILEDIATVAMESGDLASAESTAKRALAITEKQYGTDDWRDSMPLNDLGRIYSKAGDFGKAEQAFSRALGIIDKLGEGHSTLELESHIGLARIYAAQGLTAKAFTMQAHASDDEERLIRMNLIGGSEREKLAFLATLSPLISQNISLHINLAPNDPRSRDLAMTTILRRKGRVQDFIAYGSKAAIERLTPDDRKVIEEFKEVTAKLSSMVVAGPEGMTVAEFEKRVKDLESQREALESDINNRNIQNFRSPAPVGLEDVKKAIPDDAALIEFAVFRPYDAKTDVFGAARYAVYVLRKTGDVGWKDLGDAKDIDTAVAAMAAAFRDPKRTDAEKLARALDEKIMRPARGLVGTATHLLVSPDGELNIVPFNALVDENRKYLVERYSFTYLSSGRDLLRMQDQKKISAGPPIVVGNPAYGNPTGDEAAARGGRKRSTRSVTATREITDTYFAPLSGTEQEARSIRALFPDSKYLTGAAATETSLKQARSPRILHIATHGFFLEDKVGSFVGSKGRGSLVPVNAENPLLRSGLALAGANIRGKGDDDGLLTALEASGLDLWGTQMVVLSACDTGLGEISNGEGVYGLRRAFGIAGAESIVMSLWPVSDQVTRDLMISYYKDLKQGRGRGEALRRVQLEMLKKPGRNHPFYWASFIQAGDWRSIK